MVSVFVMATLQSGEVAQQSHSVYVAQYPICDIDRSTEHFDALALPCLLIGHMDAFVIRDTHKLVGKLQQRGFSAQQAEGITEAIRELDASGLATKADLQQLKADFEKALHRQTWGLVGVIFAQGAFIIAVLQVLM